ncbi:MAG: glpC [Phenylobacterium sp.]|nr:glpC [Phenylobacterium sp.]
MRTNFTDAQLLDPEVASSEAILRTCVHCGFCTATCPTYVLLGDELDSPRGRIYLIQNMLESGAPPSPETVKHVDRCLSCLSCVTTCPSGVDYMHLVDHARAHIETTFRRPLAERWLRSLLAGVLTRPALFRACAQAARLFAWAAPLAPGRLRGLLQMAPRQLPPRQASDRPGVFPATGPKRFRVALLGGCVQSVLAPNINAACVRLLTRHGVEVVIPEGDGCCGALPHHLGKRSRAEALAKAQMTAWLTALEGDGLDAILVTASGCGTTVKDYGHLFRHDPEWAGTAEKISSIAMDISEFLGRLGLSPSAPAPDLTVAYHSACSLQHGQRVREEPKRLLAEAGFKVVEPREQHLCCGSAGTYNLLQPQIAAQLRDRKVGNLEATQADVIAAGNIGCLVQIGSAASRPVVHTVELLDWATGGPKPASLVLPRPA